MTPIPAHTIFRILVHFGALYFVSEAGIVLSRHCPYVNFFSVVITKPWNPFHSSKYILVLIFFDCFLYGSVAGKNHFCVHAGRTAHRLFLAGRRCRERGCSELSANF